MRMLLILAIFAGLLLAACQDPFPGEPPFIPEVNPGFQTNPPTAEDITARIVEGDTAGYLLVKASFTEEEYAKIVTDTSSVFTIVLDEQRIVLRDDGQGSDEEARDQVFTTLVKEDIESFERALQTANQNLAQAEDNTFKWFNLRKVAEPQRSLEPFPIEQFRQGAEISIAHLQKLLALPPANLFENSLVITDVSVIEDPSRTIPNPCNAQVGDENKAWAFAKLMAEMANTPSTGVDPVDFTLNWLETWENPRDPNNETIPARTNIQNIIDTWDGLDGTVDNNFEMRFAPFKLVAIVNRVDLRENFGYGGGNAGEGRFVFCPVTSSCTPIPNFTIIFEYGVNISGCANVKAYAQEWHDLSGLTLGSAAYNVALQAITDQFTLANTDPSNPNGSSINQVRTNEIALGPWELLEFNICDPSDPVMSGCTPNQLVNTTVKQEPQLRFNEGQAGNTDALSQIFANWVNSQPASSILNNTYEVPVIEAASTEHFLGARSLPGFNTNYNWDALDASSTPMITNDEVRQQFGFNTCGECHTQGAHPNPSPMPFQHIRPGNTITGNVVQLSAFMTSTTASPLIVPDPVGRAADNVLAEQSHRETHLQDLVNSTCLTIGLVHVLQFQPLNMVH